MQQQASLKMTIHNASDTSRIYKNCCWDRSQQKFALPHLFLMKLENSACSLARMRCHEMIWKLCAGRHRLAPQSQPSNLWTNAVSLCGLRCYMPSDDDRTQQYKHLKSGVDFNLEYSWSLTSYLCFNEFWQDYSISCKTASSVSEPKQMLRECIRV